MDDKERDLYILNKIIKYCVEADETVVRFGDSIEALKSDNIYKNATAMCVLQIGELAKHLSDDITSKYDEMPWKQIKGMRDIAAHGYENFDVNILWQTLKTDIPSLCSYCKEIIHKEQS